MAAPLAASVCVAALVFHALELNGHYPLREWLVWRVALLWAYVLLFTAACVGIGQLVLVRVLRLAQTPLLESWLLAKAIGLVAFGLALYLAGAVGALHPAFAVGMPALFVAGTTKELRALVQRTATELREAPTGDRFARLVRRFGNAWALLALVVLYAIAFTPEAISLDAAWYHYPVAQDYANAGRLVAFPSEYNKALPHLDSLVYCWGFLLPGIERPFDWMLALHLEYAIVMWKLVGVGVGAQWLLGDVRSRGLWLGFFLSPMIFTFAHSVTGGAEHFVGLWAIPMLVATGRMLRDFDLRCAALLGVLSGGAILSKYQAIYMIAGCGTLIVARWGWCVALALRGKAAFANDRLWRAPLLVLGIGLAVASPHFVKNLVFYGDPLYPFLQSKLPGVHPTHELADYLFHAKLGDPDNRPKLAGLARLTQAVRLFFDFTFSPHYVVVKQKWPVIGSLFTLLLPCLLLVRRTGRIWIAVWCSFVSIAVWANTYLQDRYLNAVAAIFCAVTVALVVKVWELGRLARCTLVPLVALQVVWGADAFVYSGKPLIESTLSLVRTGYEGVLAPADRYPYFRTFAEVNRLTYPDDQVLVRGTRKTLGIDRYTHRDVPWHQANLWYEPIHDVAGLWQHYRERGITHVAYLRNTHWSGNLHSTVLVDQLIVHGGGTRHPISGSWELLALPKTAPEGDETIEVLVLDVRPLYDDGLYAAEDLRLYGPVDKKTRGASVPLATFADERGLLGLLRRADVVAIGADEKLAPRVMGALEQGFDRFETVEAMEIWLRPAP